MRNEDVAARVSEALAGAGFRTLTRSPERLEVESHHGAVSILLPTADVQRYLASSASDASAAFPDVPAQEGAVRLLLTRLWEALAADGPPVVSLAVGPVEVEVARLPPTDEEAAAARPRGSWRARPKPPER